MKRPRLYLLVLIACAAGYAWLYYAIAHEHHAGEKAGIGCLFRQLTGLPCPSCGITRSLILILKGDPVAGLALNPLCLPVLAIMVIAPVWIGMDVLRGSRSFMTFYSKAERQLCRKQIAVPAIILIAANWCWNIIKEL